MADKEHGAAMPLEHPLFIACACDRKFVEPTATMLASVDMNGDVPDAVVLLAGFGLDDLDRATLRAGAGRLGRRMRFLDITRETLRSLDTTGYTDAYPLPVLGRLLVVDHIDVPGARLLTLDSDMIVNGSLRPLVELDLGDTYFAAVHDLPRSYDLSYFNSGLTVSEVDSYRRHDVAGRALTWLAEQTDHPKFPDQDALNHVLEDRWHRLDPTWNHFCYAPNHFEPEDWEAGKVSHFAGPKPWNQPGHGGERLYYRYNGELHRRLAEAKVPARFAPSPRSRATALWAEQPQAEKGAAGGTPPLPIFLGCSCDRTLVEATATMLTSLDMNGGLPRSTVIVAAIDLEEEDRRMLRAGAGHHHIRFVDVTGERLRDAIGGKALPRHDAAMLGRLMLPDAIDTPVARLVTFASAMIINAELGPLIHRDLGANFLAATIDPRAADGHMHFHSALIMVDVDGFKYHDVGRRALRWIGERQHDLADAHQDALNDVVGVCWHRLARTWNLFRDDAAGITAEDYETCKIAQFTDALPEPGPGHPAHALYRRYRRELQRRLELLDEQGNLPPQALVTPGTSPAGTDREFVASCYEFFLGRELEDEQVARDRAHVSNARMVASAVESEEFRANVLTPLRTGTPLHPDIFRSPPTPRQLYWAMDRLPLSAATRDAVKSATRWPELLSLILSDEQFARTIGIERLAPA